MLPKKLAMRFAERGIVLPERAIVSDRNIVKYAKAWLSAICLTGRNHGLLEAPGGNT